MFKEGGIFPLDISGLSSKQAGRQAGNANINGPLLEPVHGSKRGQSRHGAFQLPVAVWGSYIRALAHVLYV